MCVNSSFQLYLRLFIVMGLTYSISGISYLISGSSTFSEWTEIFLSLQGVWIFSLFILKRRIFHLIEQRCVSTVETTKQSHNTDISLSVLRSQSVTSGLYALWSHLNWVIRFSHFVNNFFSRFNIQSLYSGGKAVRTLWRRIWSCWRIITSL